jgi:hypothetical protein
MWLTILFSMFAMAIRFKTVLDQSGITMFPDLSIVASRIDFYREKAVQCLLLADYTKCPPFTIEAFLHYYVTEYLRSPDTQFGTYLLIGIMVRIAFRMVWNGT